MLQRLLLTGLVSGAVAGVILTLVHLAFVQPMIVQAEIYEDRGGAVQVAPTATNHHSHPNGLSHTHTGGNAVHAHDVIASAAVVHSHASGVTHSHAGGNVTHQHEQAGHSHGEGAPAHDHGDGWAPDNGIERHLYTLLANILTCIGYGLLLATAFTLYGRKIEVSQGLIWGGAGFAAFAFLPGLGLPAELPGAAAGDLLARQSWWLGTAAAAVAAIALLAFAKSWSWRLVAVALLAIPHLIGAPHPAVTDIGTASPELAAHFVMVTLFSSAVLWMVLGGLGSYIFGRIKVEESAPYGAARPG